MTSTNTLQHLQKKCNTQSQPTTSTSTLRYIHIKKTEHLQQFHNIHVTHTQHPHKTPRASTTIPQHPRHPYATPTQPPPLPHPHTLSNIQRHLAAPTDTLRHPPCPLAPAPHTIPDARVTRQASARSPRVTRVSKRLSRGAASALKINLKGSPP